MDSQDKQGMGSSRRDFLKKIPLGVAGAFVLTTLGGGLLRRGRGGHGQVEFAKDSIFRPRDGGPTEA
jgi:hypothetical protein